MAVSAPQAPDPRPAIAEGIRLLSAKLKPIWYRLDPSHKAKAAGIIRAGENTIRIESCRRDFLRYVKHMWTALGIPEAYVEGEHHRLMADAFNRIAEGKLKRLILAMPPRSGKSTFASEALPTWFLGRSPNKYVIQISNGKRLASKFGAKVRDVIDGVEFQGIFPGVKLSKSTKGKEVFNTNKKGRYIALSMEARKAGEGAHLIIVDDPHSEQDVIKQLSNPNIWEDAWQQFLGIRMRAQKNAAIVVIAQRWNSRDITGRLMKLAADGKEDWEVIEFPAIIDEHTENERSFWEEGKSLESLRQERAVTPKWKWSAVYQQKPADEGANIIPRETWKDWRQKDDDGRIKFPKFDYKIQAWDPAMSSKEIANFSACTTWGTFFASKADEEKGQYSVMLIDAEQKRVDFTDLRNLAVKHYRRHNPDVLIIEEKQSGGPLRSTLFELGITAVPFIPSRGRNKTPNDKFSRLNSISDIFRAGLVYAPLDEAWATDVRESCATAGFGGADDFADTVTMCMLRFREGRFVMLPDELKASKERFVDQSMVGGEVSYW